MRSISIRASRRSRATFPARVAHVGAGLAVVLGLATAVPAGAAQATSRGPAVSGSTVEVDTPGRGRPVQPIYVVPEDLKVHPEYQTAIAKAMEEIQGWYKERVGLTFQVAPVKTVIGPTYLSMRCGEVPSPQCARDRTQIPNWESAMDELVPWTPFATQVVFGQGGGGYAGSNLVGRLAGKATVGDWVLEPISGLRDPDVIHCGYAEWQCDGGTPMGTIAHELGHAFGLHHPLDFEPGPLLMRWHGDYPDTGFLPHEVMILRNNPFFDPTAYGAGPWLDYGAPDEMKEGAVVELDGTDLKQSDRVFFMHATGEVDATLKVGSSVAKVQVPTGLGSGQFQARRGLARGNGVPVNVVPIAEPPAPPTDLKATAITESSIRLTWIDASDDETGFYVSDLAGQVTTVPAGTETFDAGPYPAGTSKCFQVASFNGVGVSRWSPQACATTLGGQGWQAKSPLTTPRTLAAVAAVGDRVYAIGGMTATSATLATVEQYDPALDRWTARRPMPSARQGASAAVVDGKIYVIGGGGADARATSIVQRYDPATDTWSIRASMSVARKYFAAATVNGKIYVFGGYNDNAAYTYVEVYDPASDTWTYVTDVPGSGPSLYASGTAIDGKVYLFASEWGTTRTLVYDVASNTFTDGAPMPTDRAYVKAAAVNGRVYVSGGYDAGTGTSLAAVEVYDPATGSWTAASPMLTGRDDHGVATLGNALYAVGGDNGQSRALDANEVYLAR